MRAVIVWLLLASPCAAQVRDEPGAWAPRYRSLADALGTVGVGVQLGADTIHAWRAPDRGHAFRCEALRVGAAFGVSEVLKLTVHEVRPNGYDAHSFPSMHTALAISAVRWRLSIGMPLGGFIGYSRVAANWHHWHDVAAGAGLGVLAARLCS